MSLLCQDLFDIEQRQRRQALLSQNSVSTLVFSEWQGELDVIEERVWKNMMYGMEGVVSEKKQGP
jgi:hypothetical protein